MPLDPSVILVTGGNGRLGRALGALGCKTASRRELDITDQAAVDRYFQSGSIGCVINAAAYTAVDAAEADQERGLQVNAIGAGCVAKAAAAHGVPCLQISTDCVFGDGDPSLPVTETNKVDPLSVYGQTKWRGEVEVSEAGGISCIARVAWLFDDGAATFIDKMLKIATGRDVLSIVDDEWGRPTPVSALAGQLMALADMLVRQPDRVPDVLHLGPPNPVSRFTWAQQIFAASEAVGGPAPRLQRVSADAFETAARRPRGLVLDVSKAERLLGSMPDWEPFSERAVRRLLT